MSFRDNLQHLRATRNMTQEQLAMLVGVSRQSVTKWEAERSYPEMDKLLKICQIFDCSLDDLVQGDLTARAAEPELAVPAAALAEDVIGYDDHQRSFARRIALGVAIFIMGAAFASEMDLLWGDGPTAIVFCAFVAAGLAFVIPASLEHSAFQKAHPYVANFYKSDELVAAKRAFGQRLVLGIGIILAGLALASFGDAYSEHLSGFCFLACASVGAGIIVHASMLNARYDIEEYNLSALEELSEEEIASIVGEDRAPQVLAKVRRSKKKGAVCGIIMLLATAVALPLMFWATWYGEPFWRQFFWIPWMVGGFLCGIACLYLDRQA